MVVASSSEARRNRTESLGGDGPDSDMDQSLTGVWDRQVLRLKRPYKCIECIKLAEGNASNNFAIAVGAGAWKHITEAMLR
jgi:hypothetical protein